MTLSFLSLVFLNSLDNFNKQGISLVILVISLSFPRILWVRRKRSESVSGVFPEFPPESPSRTGDPPDFKVV